MAGAATDRLNLPGVVAMSSGGWQVEELMAWNLCGGIEAALGSNLNWQ